MSSDVQIPTLHTPDAPSSPHTAISQVVVVVVVMMMVHHVMNRHRSLPGGLPPPPLTLATLGVRGRGRGGDVEPGAASQEPADVGHLFGSLADDVNQILEELIVAGARLGEGGQSAGVGHEAHPLLLHQLALPLLGL